MWDMATPPQTGEILTRNSMLAAFPSGCAVLDALNLQAYLVQRVVLLLYTEQNGSSNKGQLRNSKGEVPLYNGPGEY
jgi:hypothetical protein